MYLSLSACFLLKLPISNQARVVCFSGTSSFLFALQCSLLPVTDLFLRLLSKAEGYSRAALLSLGNQTRSIFISTGNSPRKGTVP